MNADAEAVAALPADRSEQVAFRDAALIVGCFVLSRLLLTAVGLLLLRSGPPHIASLPAATSYAAALPDLYLRWDSFWYIGIAQQGYTTTTPPWVEAGSTAYAFYPLYPALMWAVGELTGWSSAVAGLVVSNVSLLAALFVIYALAWHWSADRTVAALTVILLSFAPEGFIFSAVYTESLFVLLTAGAMLAFERKQYLLAGVLAALGSASRSNGVFIALYFGLRLLRDDGLKSALHLWREPERYLPIVMAPLGLFAFWWFAMLTTGDAFAQKTSMVHGWHWAFDWPWSNVAHQLTGHGIRAAFLMGASLLALLASLTLLRRDSWPLFGYCLACFLLFWTGTLANSLLRYPIVLFPILFGLARSLANRPVVSPALLLIFVLSDSVLMALWAVGSGLVL